jgi:hypothetical protein
LGGSRGDLGASRHHGRAAPGEYFRRIFEKIRKKRGVLFYTGEQILDWQLKSGPKAP